MTMPRAEPARWPRMLSVEDAAEAGRGGATDDELRALGGWREHQLPEGQGNTFIPMHRIHEIVDLGRAP